MRTVDINRIFIDTAVSRALRDIERDPDRSLRNIVDLGRVFSNGRNQSAFLQTAQKMLKKKGSAYYTLAKNTVDSVSHQTLKTFGINIGYNSCTKGTKRIRQLEAEQGFNIPWAATFIYREGEGCLSVEELKRTIDEGKAVGMYTYLVYAAGQDAEKLTALLTRHADCAFVFFLAKGLAVSRLEALCGYQNLMIALPGGDPAFFEAAGYLKERNCLYAVYQAYDDNTIHEAISPGFMEKLLPAGCTFCILTPTGNASAQARAAAKEYVLRVRACQLYPIIMMEYDSDMLAIDEVISQEPCRLVIGPKGEVLVPAQTGNGPQNIRNGPLMEMLRETMPRVTYTGGAGSRR